MQGGVSPRHSGHAAPGGAASLTGVRILVVDDDEDERDLYVMVFRQRGADVRAVGSTSAALEAIRERVPDVLLSDVCLPDVDGYELIREVRGLTATLGRLIPAVAVTGLSGASDRRRAIDAGFQVHLAKPVALDTLLTVTAALAGVRRSTDAA